MATSLLIDTSSLTYRAFFALPTSITDGQGNPVNAVRGYLDMVGHVVGQLTPDTVLHCWDDAEVPQGRLDAYPAYKIERSAPPEGIGWQFALLRRLLPALGETIVEAPGWEADDAIGTLCAEAGPEDRVVVLTGDRDLIQLVRDPVVQVWFTVSGTKQLRRFDEEAVREHYGIDADRYADFATLRGDPSDGLPGVKGIGEKTARRLVQQHPTLDAMVAAVDQHPVGLATKLREAQDYLAAMRHVVPVRADVDLRPIPPAPDPQLVTAMEADHRLDGPIGRWREVRGGPGQRGGQAAG
ncbi:MAG TPA: 5'-3' exonuclease [Euzebya sp.]|nr:5'-3' exonuclease [Euzebya sp.]